jgi:hypothetical protein
MIDTIISTITGLFHLAVDVPVFGIGILIGGGATYWLVKKNPALLQKLLTEAEAVAAKAVSSTTATSGSTTTTPKQ